MSEQINANADEVISNLSQSVAQLTQENAILTSLVSQYKKKLEEPEVAE